MSVKEAPGSLNKFLDWPEPSQEWQPQCLLISSGCPRHGNHNAFRDRSSMSRIKNFLQALRSSYFGFTVISCDYRSFFPNKTTFTKYFLLGGFQSMVTKQHAWWDHENINVKDPCNWYLPFHNTGTNRLSILIGSNLFAAPLLGDLWHNCVTGRTEGLLQKCFYLNPSMAK